jgi:hypothetical protein
MILGQPETIKKEGASHNVISPSFYSDIYLRHIPIFISQEVKFYFETASL